MESLYSRDFSPPTTAEICDACQTCRVKMLALQVKTTSELRYVAVKVKTDLPDVACASDHITILRDEWVLERHLQTGDECWKPALNTCEEHFNCFRAHVFTGNALLVMPRSKQQPHFSGFRIEVESDLGQFLRQLRFCFPVPPAPIPFHISRDTSFTQVRRCRALWEKVRDLLHRAAVSHPWLLELD